MVVHTPSGQFMPDAVTSAIPKQSGTFKHMETKTTDADRQMQSTGQVPERMPLSGRVIHVFKSMLHSIRMSLPLAGLISLVPGILVFVGIGIATALPSLVTFAGVGGLIQRAKQLAGYDSNAFKASLYIGIFVVAAIAGPAAIITSFAATLGLFCVLAPVSTLVKIPYFIQQASSMSGEELTKLQAEADKDWSDSVEAAHACVTGALNYVT